MAQDTFKNIIIGAIITVLFAFLLLGFMVTLGNEHGADISGVQEHSLNLTKLNITLSDVQENAENWRDSFEKQNIFSVVAGIVVVGIFKIGVQMLSFIVNMFDLVFVQILNNVLGIPPAVTGSIIAIVIISALFGMWRVLKQGD